VKNIKKDSNMTPKNNVMERNHFEFGKFVRFYSRKYYEK